MQAKQPAAITSFANVNAQKQFGISDGWNDKEAVMRLKAKDLLVKNKVVTLQLDDGKEVETVYCDILKRSDGKTYVFLNTTDGMASYVYEAELVCENG